LTKTVIWTGALNIESLIDNKVRKFEIIEKPFWNIF